MKTLIVYHTKTGHTLEAIKPLAEGIKQAGGEVNMILAEEFKAEMLYNSDSFIVATPCWAGSSGIIGVAKPLIDIINKLPDGSLKGKLCGGIAVHARSGGKTTLSHLQRLLSKKGCENFKAAPVIKAGVLMSLYKGPSVNKADEEQLISFGKEFVSIFSKS